MFSTSAFLGKVTADNLCSFAEATGWPINRSIGEMAPGRRLAKRADADLEQQAPLIREHVRHELEQCERVAKGGEAVLLGACGTDFRLRSRLEDHASDRDRALILYCQDKPPNSKSPSFDRAEKLLQCGAGRKPGKTWRIYELNRIKQDWAPGNSIKKELETQVEKRLLEIEGMQRRADADVFSRPAIHSQPEGPLAWCFLIDASGPRASLPSWKDGERSETEYISNRLFAIIVQPHAGTIEIGHADNQAAHALELAQDFAENWCNQTDKIKPVTHGVYVLNELGKRPRFDTLPEHRIRSVLVKKITFIKGPGTCTFSTVARNDTDVYDVIGTKAPGPPKVIAVATPAMFPVPIVAESDVMSALKGAISSSPRPDTPENKSETARGTFRSVINPRPSVK